MLDTFQKAGHIFEKESIPLLRIIAKQFWDLIALKRQMDKGVSAQQVVNQATPMIPFNRRPQLIHNLSKWTVRGLLNAIVKLDELEVLAKQPHLWSPDQMERAFLQMSKF
jgi:DNA polymerase III delta subunit